MLQAFHKVRWFSADIIDINYNKLINGVSNDNKIRYIVEIVKNFQLEIMSMIE